MFIDNQRVTPIIKRNICKSLIIKQVFFLYNSLTINGLRYPADNQ